MFSKNPKLISSVTVITLILGTSSIYGGSPSTWTGDVTQQLDQGFNWTNDVPGSGVAVFDGNGVNAPLAMQAMSLDFEEMQFISNSTVSVITELVTTGAAGINVGTGITANFDIFEHDPIGWGSSAIFTVNGGPSGDGGGIVNYNLGPYGQFYALTGSSGATVVNVIMSEGNNYFEITGTGDCEFDRVSSDDATDQILIGTSATLVIRGDQNSTIEGELSGDGGLTKTGSGSLLVMNNTYTGATEVNQGTLSVRGDLFDNVTVAAGATFKGGVSISGDLTNAGTVAPGNSIGTMNVVNYTATSSSVYEAEVNAAGQSDLIVASGSMTLAGTLNIIPLGNSYNGTTSYSILQSASPITGTFSSVISSVPALKKLSYLGNSVTLIYLPIPYIGLSESAEVAATCFSTLTGSDASAVSDQLFSLSLTDVQNAFNQMQPALYSGATWAQIDNILFVRTSYSKHLQAFSFEKMCNDSYHNDFWVDAIGQWERQHADDDQIGYNDYTGGITAGADGGIGPFRAGGALSYTFTKVDWSQSAGKGHINSYYGGFYSAWSDHVGYAMFTAMGAYNHYNTSRDLSFGTLRRSAFASHHGWEFLTGIEGGALFKAGVIKAGPFVRLDYVYLWQNGYTENGAESLDLTIESRQDQLFQTQAGLVITTTYACEGERTKGTWIPRVEISYINQSSVAREDYDASFVGSACEFEVSGWNIKRNLGMLGASLTYHSLDERVGVSFQYDGQYGSNYISQSGNIILNFKF